MNLVLKWDLFLEKNEELLKNFSFLKVYFREKKENIFFEENQKNFINKLTDIIHEFHEVKDFSEDQIQKLVENSLEKMQQLKNDLDRNQDTFHAMLYLLLEDFEKEFKENIQQLFHENNELKELQEFTHKKSQSKKQFFQFKKIFSQLFQTKEKINYQEITEYLIDKTIKEFHLEAIQLDYHLTWKEKCEALERVIRTIQKIQKKIGLPIENVGVDGKLSIYITNNYLKKNNYNGLHVWNMKGSLIVLDYEGDHLEETWLHEYIHFLDKECAKKYLKEQQGNIDNIKTYPKESISQIILQKIASNEVLDNQVLRKVAPLISLMLTGKNIDEYREEIFLDKKEICYQLGKNIFGLSDKIIEKNSIVYETVHCILEQYINMPHAHFSWDENHNLKIIDEHKIIDINLTNFWQQIKLFCQKEKYDYNDFQKNIQNNLNQNLEERSLFGKLLKNLLEEKKLLVLGDSLNNSPIIYKVANKITEAAIECQKETKKNLDIFLPKYWLLPLEILARVGQDLVNPILEQYEDEYIEENEIDKVAYLYPYLGKKERELFIHILHEMASYIGIQNINHDLQSLESLSPNIYVDLDLNLKMHQNNLLIPKIK
jgi:hypothetical protein